MDTCLILTIISDDRPGVIETLASCIEKNNGSWQESRMAHLDGKFAGILRVTLGANADMEVMRSALTGLASEGIDVLFSVGKTLATNESKSVSVSVIGPDRAGIVLEVSRAFAKRKLNVGQLDTDCTSMPWSGDPQFEAHYQLHIASDTNMDDLQESLDAIADDLALDIIIDDSAE